MQSEGISQKEDERGSPDWRSLVEQVRTDDRACPHLWAAFESGLRIFLSVHLGRPVWQINNKIRRVLSAVAAAIHAGQLHDPAGLPALVRLTARRFLDQDIRSGNPCPRAPAVNARPELESVPTIDVLRVWTALPAIEREILARYYGNAEEPERICAGLHISRNEFRTRKEKAKRRLQRAGTEA